MSEEIRSRRSSLSSPISYHFFPSLSSLLSEPLNPYLLPVPSLCLNPNCRQKKSQGWKTNFRDAWSSWWAVVTSKHLRVNSLGLGWVGQSTLGQEKSLQLACLGTGHDLSHLWKYMTMGTACQGFGRSLCKGEVLKLSFLLNLPLTKPQAFSLWSSTPDLNGPFVLVTTLWFFYIKIFILKNYFYLQYN